MKSAYARAGRLLYESGARLLIIEALLILLLPIPVYFTLSGVSSLLLSFVRGSLVGVAVIAALSSLAEIAFSFFVTVPLVCGLFYLSHRIASGKDASLADLFYPFSTRARYRKALSTGKSLLLGCAIVYLVAILVWYAFYLYLPKLLVCAYFCVSAVILSGYLLLPLFFFAVRREYGRAGGALVGLRLRLSFLPWILLGLLTVGVLLLADVLPRLLVVSFEPLHSNDIMEDGTTPSLRDK